MAAEYGLNDTTYSTMAAFFDYDNDGDLDMYLVVNQILPGNNPSIFRPKITDGSFPSTGRLYRNDWDSVLKHPVFTNVTKQSGVTIEGYGHGVTIADFNKDGWKDIFVTNDFNSNDLLYINNHDGTFTDKASTYFKHTSANGMGQDVIDINNDGLSDVVELDMNPEDNYRKKMMMGSICAGRDAWAPIGTCIRSSSRARIAKTVLCLPHADLRVSGTVAFAGSGWSSTKHAVDRLTCGAQSTRRAGRGFTATICAIATEARSRRFHRRRLGVCPRFGRELGPSTPVVARASAARISARSHRCACSPTTAASIGATGAGAIDGLAACVAVDAPAIGSWESPIKTPTESAPIATAPRSPRCESGCGSAAAAGRAPGC